MSAGLALASGFSAALLAATAAGFGATFFTVSGISVAALAALAETPGAFYANQFHSPDNPAASHIFIAPVYHAKCAKALLASAMRSVVFFLIVD